ncbi:MAG: hypothetical protein ABIG44_12325 [Planctomycetota bacterium]
MNPSALLQVFRDPPLDGPENMARDEHLLYADSLTPAALRIYAWTPPTISLGYFQAYGETQHLPADLRALPVVRRLTGGGAILHDREITYGLVIDHDWPPAQQAPEVLYKLVHTCWLEVCAADEPRIEMASDSLDFPSPRRGPFFCFEKPGRTDLVIGPDKLLGSAQRRAHGRVLQHGSLLLGRGFTAHPGASLGDPTAEQAEQWITAFIAALARRLDLTPRPATWSPARLADVAQRRIRYASAVWTRRR